MWKYLFTAGIILLLAGTSFGRDLELIIKDFQCTEEGVHISYSIKNGRDFTRPNVKIGFKILVEEKSIGCEEIKLDVPANAPGDEIMEVTIQAPCKGKTYKLISTVFGSSISRYKIDNWMEGCP